MNEFIKEKIKDIARELYSNKLPYHNYNHVLDVLKYANKFISRCEKENIIVNRDAIFCAVMFHDAGYQDDHEIKGFDSKEEYSANLAEKKLLELGLDDVFVDAVKKIIMDTYLTASPSTNEGKIMRAADVSTLSQEYEIFLDAANRIKKDLEILKGEDIKEKDFRVGTYNLLKDNYLNQDLNVTSFDVGENGESIILSKIRENLERYIEEVSRIK